MVRDQFSFVNHLLDHPGRGGCGVGALIDPAPSHDTLRQGIGALCSMEHRGGGIDETGDGAGVLLRTDREFFARFLPTGKRLPDGHPMGVGVLFFPLGEKTNLLAWQASIESTFRRFGLAPLAWRHVPVRPEVLGLAAERSRRDIWQILFDEGMVPRSRLRYTLFQVKKQLERQQRDIYIASLSHNTIVYKALATSTQLSAFFPDLQDTRLRTDLVIFHRRFSTNTFSNWYLAQCFRLMSHNGEINTIKANRSAVRNLEVELRSEDVLMPQGSDSADFDRTIELFLAHDVPLAETLFRLMPLAWRDLAQPTPKIVEFYQGVQRALGTLGAWEGPAAVIASDGDTVCAMLDRMGLRPLRWLKTRTGRIILGSEVGPIPAAMEEIEETGQLEPGEALAVDLSREPGQPHRVIHPAELLERVVAESAINFPELATTRLFSLPRSRAQAHGKTIKPDQRALNLFGWNKERVRMAKHMADEGKEPITSMGFDRPLAVFSAARPPLAKYFKQIVAVVTNPPIDPIREGSAFDTTVYLGESPSLTAEHPHYQPAPQYQLDSPFVGQDQWNRLRDGAPGRPNSLVLDATFIDTGSPKAVSERIWQLVDQAIAAAKTRTNALLLLSDRDALLPVKEGEAKRLPLPMLLLIGALHASLSEAGLRRRVSLVVESGEVQEAHDAALLIACGADALFAHLLMALAEGDSGAEEKLLEALRGGLLRIMSKMGITTLDGYRGSELFEAVGVSAEVVEHFLPGIQSHLGGLDLADIYADIVWRTQLGGMPHQDLDVNIYRRDVWQKLQETARGNDGAYQQFLQLIDETPPVYLRDLLTWKPATPTADIAQTATAEEIIRTCFRGAAMSHGALHRTAHRAIAAAFNQFEAASNCGEGGEDTRRDRGGAWQSDRSRIRQIGSARFGVDARFLIHADEIQIKIGQGAKPGEGGMLPGAKVTAEIAHIRKTQVGVTLISPPPHHDIYSIEDLAQLLYNLGQLHPHARLSVKIPAVTDVGTIAVGIAKAGAHTIDISGFEGGTGAAASSSIEHAGLPLERALAEVHQALVLSGIRHRVLLRADGGIKTGQDVAKILALGANEVSLGTALMIAEQCIFCHGCSKGNCPAGITTQSDLTARRLMTDKKGRPADAELPDMETERYQDALAGVTRYLVSLGDEVRAILAQLGLRHPKELVGRADLLEQIARGNRSDKVDLSALLHTPDVEHDAARPAAPVVVSAANQALCERVSAGETALSLQVHSTDRALTATLAGQLSLVEPEKRKPLQFAFAGFAGQGLGFGLIDGMHITLDGYANDSVGAAMSGGTIVIRPPARVEPQLTCSILGNNAGYGATGGSLFACGAAGQRFGVRNSGATLICEGAGKYAFEYMTGGVGVVLGPVASVCGSGMTGGVLWVYRPRSEELEERIHRESVCIATPSDDDLTALQQLISHYSSLTHSRVAAELLADWNNKRQLLHKVVPLEVAKQTAPPPVEEKLLAVRTR